jgi:hypothetical protein
MLRLRHTWVCAPPHSRPACNLACLQALITAVGVTACRHGHVYHMLNCFGGERHAYAVVAFKLVLQAGLKMAALWYDINCR